jgi:hypothetical protein
VIRTCLAAVTGEVETVNVADDCPPGTVTNDGAEATPVFALLSSTNTPPEGAVPARRTVAVAAVPPRTIAGLIESASTPVALAGRIVKTAPASLPWNEAVSVAVAGDVTVEVAALKVAEFCPCDINRKEGGRAFAVLLRKPMLAPPEGAPSARVTVPTADSPPVTDCGATVSSIGGLTSIVASRLTDE